MIKAKQHLRHKILNLITMINLLVAESEIRQKDKEDIVNCADLTAVLVGFEDIILGIKPKFYLQKADLAEVLESILVTHEHMIIRKKVIVELVPIVATIKIDRYFIVKAIEFLLYFLFHRATNIRIDHNNTYLLISFKGKISFPRKKSLISYLKESNIKYDEFLFHLSLEILKMAQFEIVLGKQVLEVRLGE